VAPSSFRVAIRHNPIVPLENGTVTCRDQEAHTGKICSTPVAAEACIRRWLQPVLPDRFITVRDYGRLAPTHRPRLEQTREWRGSWPQGTQTARPVSEVKAREQMARCPTCGRLLIRVQTLPPQTRQPPSPPPATGGLFWTSRSLSAALTLSGLRGFSASTRANTALVELFISSGSGVHKMIHGHFPIAPATPETSHAPGPLLSG